MVIYITRLNVIGTNNLRLLLTSTVVEVRVQQPLASGNTSTLGRATEVKIPSIVSFLLFLPFENLTVVWDVICGDHASVVVSLTDTLARIGPGIGRKHGCAKRFHR